MGILMKLRRSAQVTLPAEVRKALNLHAGDYLEAEVVKGGVLLKPVAVVDREQAWDRLVEIVDRPKAADPHRFKSAREEEEWLAQEVGASRKEHAQGRD